MAAKVSIFMPPSIGGAAAFSYPKSLGAAGLALVACTASADDRWTSPDKAVHLAGGCVTAIVAADRARDLHPAAQWALATAPWVLKEALDATAGTTGWSWKDLAVSALGAGACVPLGRFAVRLGPGQAGVTYRVEF